MSEEFLNEIKNEEKNINEQIFREYFNYQSPPFLVKDLYEDNQKKNDRIVKYLSESLINLRNSIDSKKSEKLVYIAGKIIDFNKQQRGKGHPFDFTTCIKLARQQILQIFPLAFVLVKAVSTSEKSLNEIRQIIYSLCQIKETTEKVYNNINL